MKESVSESRFIDVFCKIRPDNFSYEGLSKLFEHIEQYEADSHIEMEFDVIGLCCDFAEYEDLKEFQKDYGKEYECIEDIENETLVIPINDESFIIQQF